MRKFLAAVGVFVFLSVPALRSQTASVNRLLLTLQQQDLSGTPIVNRTIGFVTYNGVGGVFTNSILTSTGSTSITLPSTTMLQFYLRNTHATANITVTWTSSGGSSNVVKKVGPGGVLAFWETQAGDGITALALQSDTANATYESFLGF